MRPDRRPERRINHHNARRGRLSSALAVALCAWCFAAPARAQDVADGVRIVESADDFFGEAIDVDLVNVEVWVTDRDGRPVLGLDADDFTVREDGTPVAISHFTEVASASAATDGADGESKAAGVEGAAPTPTGTADAAASPRGPEGAGASAGTSAESTEEPRIVFALDDLHLRRHERRRIIEDLRAALDEGLYQADRVSVVSLDQRLRFEAGFGSTREGLDLAFDRIEERPTFGEEDDRAKVLLMNQLWEIWDLAEKLEGFQDPCDEVTSKGLRIIEGFARVSAQRTAATTAHLVELSSALAGIPGPKMVFYAGGGLAVVPAAEYQYFLSQLCPHERENFQKIANDTRFVDRMSELNLHANAQRVTFYMLDASGGRASSQATVDNWHGSRFRPDATFDQIAARNEQNGLHFIAEETGGKAIFNHNRAAEPLVSLANDLSHYYSLAYQPPRSENAAKDGEDHEIEVEVDGKKLNVRHRKSYRERPADERMADRLRTALLLDITENPLGIEVAHRAIESQGSIYTVPLAVTVPLGNLVLMERDGVRRAQIRMQVAARDSEGRTSVFHQKSFQVELDPDVDLASTTHSFVVDLSMRGGPHVLAVGLRDEVGRETSYRASKLDVRVPADTVAAAGD